MKRPHIDFQKTETDAIVIVHFKKMGKAVRFAAKLLVKPPKGVQRMRFHG